VLPLWVKVMVAEPLEPPVHVVAQDPVQVLAAPAQAGNAGVTTRGAIHTVASKTTGANLCTSRLSRGTNSVVIKWIIGPKMPDLRLHKTRRCLRALLAS
jgi:hypothetical protein